jgi:hypothetical protein
MTTVWYRQEWCKNRIGSNVPPQRRNHRPHERAGLSAPSRVGPAAGRFSGKVRCHAGAFHRERDIQICRGRGRNEDGQFYVRYCFADPTDADAFYDRFGGRRLTAPSSEAWTTSPKSIIKLRPKLALRATGESLQAGVELMLTLMAPLWFPVPEERV